MAMGLLTSWLLLVPLLQILDDGIQFQTFVFRFMLWPWSCHFKSLFLTSVSLSFSFNKLWNKFAVECAEGSCLAGMIALN